MARSKLNRDSLPKCRAATEWLNGSGECCQSFIKLLDLLEALWIRVGLLKVRSLPEAAALTRAQKLIYLGASSSAQLSRWKNTSFSKKKKMEN